MDTIFSVLAGITSGVTCWPVERRLLENTVDNTFPKDRHQNARKVLGLVLRARYGSPMIGVMVLILFIPAIVLGMTLGGILEGVDDVTGALIGLVVLLGLDICLNHMIRTWAQKQLQYLDGVCWDYWRPMRERVEKIMTDADDIE